MYDTSSIKQIINDLKEGKIDIKFLDYWFENEKIPFEDFEYLYWTARIEKNYPKFTYFYSLGNEISDEFNNLKDFIDDFILFFDNVLN